MRTVCFLKTPILNASWNFTFVVRCEVQVDSLDVDNLKLEYPITTKVDGA